MTDLCENCEYIKGYIELGSCPVCKSGKLFGHVVTRGLYCTNGCKEFPFAVSFYVKKNCDVYFFRDYYSFTISERIDRKKLQALAIEFHLFATEIHRSILKQTPIAETGSLTEALQICKVFEKMEIPYHTNKPIPYMSRFDECQKMRKAGR